MYAMVQLCGLGRNYAEGGERSVRRPWNCFNLVTLETPWPSERLQSRPMLQITEIKCLSSGVGGELAPEAPGLAPSPTRFPATRSSASPLTALQVKVSRPKGAVRVSCPRPCHCHKIAEVWHELAGIAVAVRILIQSSTSRLSHQRRVSVQKHTQLCPCLSYTLKQPDP